MSEVRASPSVSTASDVRPFFRERLDEALARQRVTLGPDTEAYLVNLLACFLAPERLFVVEEDGRVGREPLAFILKRAVEAPREQRAAHLRRLGDTALYTSGFFSDSLSRSLVDVDYYAAMGGRAYDALRDLSPERSRRVFAELAEKFVRVVDLFSEISERAAMTSNAGLLRLYERYVRTGSERLRQVLQERGVVPVLTRPTEQ